MSLGPIAWYDVSQGLASGKVPAVNAPTWTTWLGGINLYKFGVYSKGKYYWYWFGQPVADNREKMREIYSALLQVKKDNDIPFIYKIKRV
jgi:hypothetical protein